MAAHKPPKDSLTQDDLDYDIIAFQRATKDYLVSFPVKRASTHRRFRI